MELWNTAKRMKEIAEILQGAAWIGAAVGTYLGIKLVKQWKNRKRGGRTGVFFLCVLLPLILGSGERVCAAESGSVTSSRIQMERIGSSSYVCRDSLEIYLNIYSLTGIRTIRLWQNQVLILEERFQSEGEELVQIITDWERTLQLYIEHEGVVELRVEMEDTEGNMNGKTQYWEADFTAPVMTAGWQGVQNQGYFQGNGTLILYVKEKNFQPSDIQIQWIKHPETFRPEVSWTGQGDGAYAAAISFEQDGVYELEISGTDLAGNSLIFENQGEHGKIHWEVDGTAPDIIIEGIQEGAAYNGSVQLQVHLFDKNVEKNLSMVKLEGRKNGETAWTQVNHEEMLFMWEPSPGQEMDDLYQLSIHAVDRAGNTAEKAIHFWINRSGSRYDLDGLDEDGTYSGKKQMILEETNLNQVNIYTLMYVWEGETRILEEGKDYVRNIREEEYGMHYQYVLNQDLFIRKGQYAVTLLTEDTAGNKMSNLQNAYDNFSVHVSITSVSKIKSKERKQENTSVSDVNEHTGRVHIWLYGVYIALYLLRKNACILRFPVV